MHDAGFQIATHSNGDREIDMVLTAIERAEAKNPRPDARQRIEHASVMNQALLDRAKKAGVILVFHSYMWEHGDNLASYGEKRLAMIHPYRTAIDMGIPRSWPFRFHRLCRRPFAAHSGHGHAQGRKRRRLRQSISGQRGRGYQGVDARRRLRHLRRKNKGSITPGKLADFAVLRKDPRKVPPDSIKDIVIEATYIGGNHVWQAPSNAVAFTH